MEEKIKYIIDLFSQPSKYRSIYHNNFDGIRLYLKTDKIFETVSVHLYGYNNIEFGEVKFIFENDIIRLKFHNKLSFTLIGGAGYNEGDTLTKYKTIKYKDLISQKDIENKLVPLVLEMFKESWGKIRDFLNKCSLFK